MLDVIPPFRPAIPIDEMRGDDDVDDKLLHEMSDKAVRYVCSFAWCLEVYERYFGDGYGGIVALFLFRVTIREAKKPEWVWVIVGDCPSCYLEFEGFGSPRAALLRYVEGLEDWTNTSANKRESRKDLPPIYVPPGEEYVELLKKKAAGLRDVVLPHLPDE